MQLLKSKERKNRNRENREDKINVDSLRKVIETLDFFGSVNIDATLDSEFATKAKLNFKKIREDIEKEYSSYKKQYKNVDFSLTEIDTMIHDIINFLELLESGIRTLDENSFVYAYIARIETAFLLENGVYNIPFSLNDKLIEYLIDKRQNLASSISLLNNNYIHYKNTKSPRAESFEKAIERYKILDKILKEEIETRKEMASEIIEAQEMESVLIEPPLKEKKGEIIEEISHDYSFIPASASAEELNPEENMVQNKQIETAGKSYFREGEKPLYFSFSNQQSVKISEYLKCKYLNEFSLIESAGKKREYYIGREDNIVGEKYINKDFGLIKLEYGQGYSINDFGNLILTGFLSDFDLDEKVVIAYYDFMCNLFNELYNRNMCPGINGLSLLKKEYGTYVRYVYGEKKIINERYCKLKNAVLNFVDVASFYFPEINGVANENNIKQILAGNIDEIKVFYEKIENEHCSDEETHNLFSDLMDMINKLSGVSETDYSYGARDNVSFIFKKISSKGIVDVSSYAKENLQYAIQCFMQVDAPIKEFGIKLGREYLYLVKYVRENEFSLKYSEREKHLRHMDIGIRGEIISHYEDLIMNELKRL